jgi:hypothetical protein
LEVENFYEFHSHGLTLKKRQWLQIHLFLVRSKSVEGELVLSKQVKKPLECSLTGEIVQNRATGLRQELIKSKYIEI